MGIKLFGPGGVDQKSNHLTRLPEKLRDALNIRYNSSKEYTKRPGTDMDTGFSGDTYSDVWFIKSLNEYFFRDSGKYYVYPSDPTTGVIGAKREVPLCDIDPTSDDISHISGCEYLNTFIFTHKNGQRGTFKYDGKAIYAAGLPVPEMSLSVAAGSAGFMLSFYDFIDNQGNEIFGPSKIQTLASLTLVQTITPPKPDGFYGGYLTVAGGGGVVNYALNGKTLAGRTLTYNGKSIDIVAGSKIAVRTVNLSRFAQIYCAKSAVCTISIASPGVITVPTTKEMTANQAVSFSTTGALPTGLSANTVYYVKTIVNSTTFTVSATSGGVVINTSGSQSGVHTVSVGNKSFYEYILLEVESVSAPNIIFTSESFGDSFINITSVVSPTFNIMANLVIRNYISSSETTGYVQNSFADNCVVDSSSTSSDGNVTLSLTSSISPYLLSDVYDITTSKIRPPKCKFIKTYGDQIACGNVLSFWDFTNRETTYTNNDLVMYSDDVSTGDLGENFSEINRQLIGDTYDGEITGLIRAKDSLLVTKKNSIYSLDGVLINGQYAVRKIETNEIGCYSDKSLMVIDGTIIFQGKDGLYVVSGNYAKKISTPIDPFFAQSGFDPSLTRSVMDLENEFYLFFTNKGVAAFNFEFKEWFIWDLGLTSNIARATNGLTVNNTYDIRMFYGDICYKFIDAKKDFNFLWIADNLLEKYLPINGYIKSAWFDMKEPSLIKKVFDFRLFSLSNAGQTLTARICRDWDTSKKTSDFSIAMITSSIKTVLRKVDIQQCQSFSIEIENNVINEDLNISGYEIGVTTIQDKDKNV